MDELYCVSYHSTGYNVEKDGIQSMARCKRTTYLDVYHKRRDGGNGIENAVVLCEKCYNANRT